MDTHGRAVKRVLAAGLIALGLGWAAQKADAGPNPDTMIVSVTPSPSSLGYGVLISSVNSNGYEFGQVDLKAATVSTAAIVVMSSGTASVYFGMQILSDGGWTARGTHGVTDHNIFEMLGRFQTGQPEEVSGFNTTNDIITGTMPGTGNGLYNQSAATAPGDSQELWLKLFMPQTVGASGQRTMTLIISGLSS